MRKLSLLIILISFALFANAEKHAVTLEGGVKCNFETEKNRINGEYRSYYENGKLKTEGSFSEGNRVGFWVFYRADGKIQCIRDYKDNFNYEEKTADNKSVKVSEPGRTTPQDKLTGQKEELLNVISSLEAAHTDIISRPINK